jgi:O-antigen/teichoic acid export membrane protein
MGIETGLDGWRGNRTRHFARHVFEMTVAMVLGMCILGAAFREIHLVVFGAGFDNAWHRHTELAVFAMTFNMTMPMVLWMRHRGHSWQRSGEMGSAMFLLALGLLVMFWLGAVSAHIVLPLEMVLMLPSMIGVMLYRREDYSKPHLAKAAAVQGVGHSMA